MKNKKELPCIKCPVLAVCIPKYKNRVRLKCDIIWKYVSEDTRPIGKMNITQWFESSRRAERLRRVKQVMEQYPTIRDITDGRDVL